MSASGKKKRYTSVMEKIIKNAVSETSKVLETVIAELKAELLRVQNENENLKIRCSQFEEVVKKRSVYRETGTSPEPWIMDKCDKAVQCDFIVHNSADGNQNFSDNETQSEASVDEKESSNDSFSFMKISNMEDDSCEAPDFSNETTPEKSVDTVVDRSCLDSQIDNMEDNAIQTPSSSSDQQNVPTEFCSHDELHKESDTCYETSEMEIQEDAGAENAKTDQSLLKCQETDQTELNKKNLSLPEDVCVSTETENVTFEKERAQSSVLSLSPENESPLGSLQEAIEEMTMNAEIKQQAPVYSSESKIEDSSTPGVPDNSFGNQFVQVDASSDASIPPEQPVHISEDMETTSSPAASEPTPTKIDGKAVQSVASKTIPAKEAKNTSQSTSPPKSQYFLRRGRCTSVTLEDAMLLLDAVSQQKYKSPPKKHQTKDASKNVTTPKLGNIPETKDSSNSEDASVTTESLHPPATHSNANIESAEAIELDVCPSNVDVDHQETTCSVEAVVNQGVATSTPIQRCDSKRLGDADSAGLSTESQHDHQEILSTSDESLSTLVTEDATPVLTSTKLDESMQAGDTSSAKIGFEEHDESTTSPAKPSLVEPPNDASVPPVTQAKQKKKTLKQDKVLEVEEIVSSEHSFIDHQHDPELLSATPSAKAAGIQPEEDIHTEMITTEKVEITQAVQEPPTQKDIEVVQVDLALPTDLLSPSEALDHNVSNPHLPTPIETIGIFDQISGPPPHDGCEAQENENAVSASSAPITSPLPNPPAQPTMLLKMTGDSGGQSSSFVKTIATSSALSPAQLSAVVSAVRSTQSVTSPASPSAGPSSGKKALVAVPFSLQSVMRPHHKIIVIPRQCKVPPSQTVVKDQAVVLKQTTKTYAKESTTTFISTTEINQVNASTMENTVNSTDQQQTTSTTTVTQSPVNTSAVITEPSSSGPAVSPCKNTVQIKLNRIPFPVSSKESVSVADMPVDTPKVIVKKKPGRPPLKKHLIVSPSQPESQPKKDRLPGPLVVPLSLLSSKPATLIQSSPKQQPMAAEKVQQPTPEQLSPVVAADHSYPQYRMTKSQFLAKLDVSPVITPPPRRNYVTEKEIQKASLVERLRSHLKPHIKTIIRAPDSEKRPGGSKVIAETKQPNIATAQEASEINPDQQSENVLLPDPVPQTDENRPVIPKAVTSKTVMPRSVTPKTSPTSKNVSNKSQVKRKPSPKRKITPTKSVKKRKLQQQEEVDEDMSYGRKLSPMQAKIMNSNALLSCVRKGIKKKSFLCKFCKKEFGKKKDIETHIQVHVGKKPFQCNICHRRFSRTIELSRHLRRHNNDKKYQCTSCGKSFLEYANLKRHSYVHTGEKPFTCPHCPKTFTQSGHMKTHMKTKHKDMDYDVNKQYHCTFCGKSFRDYNTFKRHSYTHTGEKPFTCSHCPKSFSQLGHMRTHIKNQHKDVATDF